VGGSTRRQRDGPAIVSIVSTGELLRFQVDVDRDSAPISGSIRPDGGSARAFAGWTELFAALETAIAELRGSAHGEALEGEARE
jgi:hypothetical protein